MSTVRLAFEVHTDNCLACTMAAVKWKRPRRAGCSDGEHLLETARAAGVEEDSWWPNHQRAVDAESATAVPIVWEGTTP